MKKYLVALLLLFAVPASAGTVCRMNFSMSGWSFFYRTAEGDGTISCENGQTASVHVWSKGGGVTFGRSKIKDGTGRFTEVDSIEDLFGTYVQSEAHAGAGKSTKASAMTKGTVSLSIVGKGKGVDVGISFGKFVIERR
ncbi:MAG TPA: hypothetical protein VGQ36_05820 [Thermoanaerobaculia bacterium]|jgi:hypothetical protein|nr:hypothetical protein [Thermoanaerobaculia bacterium]